MRGLLYTLILFIFLCVGCTTTKIVEVPVETVKTEYITHYDKDSIFIHDSVDRYLAGDTVYLYKQKYIYKYLTKIDTVLKTDSIEVPITVETIKEVKTNHIYWYQYILMGLGGLTALIGTFKLGQLIKQKL